MDLCADQLLAHLPAGVHGIDVAPPFRHLFASLPGFGKIGFNADRLLNRHFLLASRVRSLLRQADFIHIADHSYAHLALSLPAGRVGVYCHDLDAFRCLLEPSQSPRPQWFRWLAQRTLAGIQRAAVVFHNSAEVGRQLRERKLVRHDRLVHAPLGVAEEFTPHSNLTALPEIPPAPFLLHVGGDMPRKRLDVLLDLFAVLHRQQPELRLVQVGPPWLAARSDQIERLGIGARVIKFTDLSRPQLAELYRRAEAVLVPSEFEGFGLPVIEALACGATVIASDLPVLREVGGEYVRFVPLANIQEWSAATTDALARRPDAHQVRQRLIWASRYKWQEHANVIASIYLRLSLMAR